MSPQPDRITFELALFGSASRSVTEFVANVDPERLDRPSPCAGWTGRQVLNHMIGSANLFAACARGERPSMPDWQTAPDVLGDDVEFAYVVAADAVTRAFQEPGVLDGDVTLPFATMPAPFALRLVMADHTTHAWDLAQTAGHAVNIDDTVTAMALDTLRASVTPESRAAGYYAAPTTARPGCAPLDHLAAFTGRTATR